MYYTTRYKTVLNKVKWTTICFFIGGLLGILLSIKYNDFNFKNKIEAFLYVGYLFSSLYLLIYLIKKWDWFSNLSVLSFPTITGISILLIIFIPTLWVISFLWYFLKLIVLFIISYIGLIPFYLINVFDLINIKRK